jgi:hypothetical protein
VKYSVLRETIGRLLICSDVIVDVTVVACVCTSSLRLDTSTVSDSAPISSVALISPGRDARRRTSEITAVLKPLSEIVTVYVPGSRAGTEKAPDVFVTASDVTFVALFLTLTVAPGTTPPALSTTRPLSDEADDWA